MSDLQRCLFRARVVELVTSAQVEKTETGVFFARKQVELEITTVQVQCRLGELIKAMPQAPKGQFNQYTSDAFSQCPRVGH